MGGTKASRFPEGQQLKYVHLYSYLIYIYIYIYTYIYTYIIQIAKIDVCCILGVGGQGGALLLIIGSIDLWSDMPNLFYQFKTEIPYGDQLYQMVLTSIVGLLFGSLFKAIILSASQSMIHHFMPNAKDYSKFYGKPKAISSNTIKYKNWLD